MFKKVIARGLLGFPLGIALGYIITIILSVIYGEGHYSSAPPLLIADFESEIAAVVFQAVLCGVLGSAFAAASVVWQMETWSIARQTAVYFLVTAVVMFGVAYLNRWMEPSLEGFLIYAAIFVGIFIVIWLILRLAFSTQIKQVNDKLKSKNVSSE